MPSPKDPLKFKEYIIKQRESHLGKPLSEKHKLKISESKKGHCVLEETRRKLSDLNRGENNPFYGKHHSEETKRKISEINKGRVVAKGENHPNWKGGISFEPYCINFDEPFKERCREFFGRICVECGKTEAENGRKLDVHHVNFNKMACCNDVLPLFVALCHPCHAKTNHNNREYWEYYFTKIIYEKYGGQCYLPKISTNPD
jgi:hypothetical protein